MYFQNDVKDYGCVGERACSFKYTAQWVYQVNNMPFTDVIFSVFYSAKTTFEGSFFFNSTKYIESIGQEVWMKWFVHYIFWINYLTQNFYSLNFNIFSNILK